MEAEKSPDLPSEAEGPGKPMVSFGGLMPGEPIL